MGLPDVQPMQAALMKDLESQLRSTMQSMSPESMIKTWMPASMQGAEQMQKMFWSQVQQTMSGLTHAAGGAMTSFSERKPKD